MPGRVRFVVAEKLSLRWEVNGACAAVVMVWRPLLVGGEGSFSIIVLITTATEDVLGRGNKVLVAGGGCAEVEAAGNADVVVGGVEEMLE